MKKIISIFTILILMSSCRQTLRPSNIDFQTNLSLPDTSFVSPEQEYWTNEDTTLKTINFDVGIICIKDTDKIELRISEGIDVMYSFYLEPDVSTNFNDGVYNSEYSGVDPNFEPITVFYIKSSDYSKSAIIIKSEWYEICYYMGKY